jgi:hypothetical protein
MSDGHAARQADRGIGKEFFMVDFGFLRMPGVIGVPVVGILILIG